jgi:hypothetical protein
MDLQLDVNEAFLASLISHLRDLNFEIPEGSYRKSFRSSTSSPPSIRIPFVLQSLVFRYVPLLVVLIFSQALSLFLVREFLARSLQRR